MGKIMMFSRAICEEPYILPDLFKPITEKASYLRNIMNGNNKKPIPTGRAIVKLKIKKRTNIKFRNENTALKTLYIAFCKQGVVFGMLKVNCCLFFINLAFASCIIEPLSSLKDIEYTQKNKERLKSKIIMVFENLKRLPDKTVMKNSSIWLIKNLEKTVDTICEINVDVFRKEASAVTTKRLALSNLSPAAVYLPLVFVGIGALALSLFASFVSPIFDPNVARVLVPMSVAFLAMLGIDYHVRERHNG
jgi:hypothetical protein